MMRALLLTLLLPACAATVEPLPDGCAVQSEKVRLQLCPEHAMSVVCSNTAQTNFDAAHCGGPDWTEGRQVTGNAWCCD